MKIKPRTEVLNAYQYIYASSGPSLAVMFGGIFDPTDDSIYVLTAEGVRQAVCGRAWFIVSDDEDTPVRLSNRTDIQHDYEPLDWREAHDTLGGNDWAGCPTNAAQSPQ